MCNETNTGNQEQALADVQKIVDQEIRPALRMHGGDMQIVSFENNVLRIKYQGAGGCCPGAAMSTLPMIQGILEQKYSPDIKVETA